MLGFPVYHEMPEFTQTHVHRVSDTTHPSHPLLSPSPPTFSLSQHQSPLNESVLRIRWPRYWSFSFSISLSNEYSGLISFKIDWLNFLAVQGTLKSLLQLTFIYLFIGFIGYTMQHVQIHAPCIGRQSLNYCYHQGIPSKLL